jgi:DnaJ-class molecular chaperone
MIKGVCEPLDFDETYPPYKAAPQAEMMEQEPNPYKVLQVDPGADIELIQQAYNYLAAKYAPENAGTGNKEKFDSVTKAWQLLSDPNRKKECDKAMAEAADEFQGTFLSALMKLEMLVKPPSNVGEQSVPEALRSIRSALQKALSQYSQLGRLRPEQSNSLECSFCAKQKSDVGRLISGPGVVICNYCVDTFNGFIADPSYVGTRAKKCSFCGKLAETVRKVISSANARICDECIDLCNEILEEEKDT